MRSLSGVSPRSALCIFVAFTLAAIWRATVAAEPRAAPRDLAGELALICERAKGRVGVSVVHVESGREVATGGEAALPLYSVFKLPLAVVVLKAIEREELSLDQEAVVEARDVAPGAASNTHKWRNLPVTLTVRQLLEFSLIDSDNTSSDKLLELVGGPAGVTRQIRALGFSGIDIRGSTKEIATAPRHPNHGSALSLARLLSGLQRGVVLRPAELAVLWNLMGRSQTGKHRLPASLPPGTPVVEKTGSGKAGSATNDVGVLTLPNEQGHLAIAVLITGSTLPAAEQERLIAEIGRTSFDAYAIRP